MPTSPAWSAVTSPREVVDVISSDSSVLLKIRNFRENPTSNVDDSADASKSSMPVLAMPVFAISKLTIRNAESALSTGLSIS